MAIDKEPAQLAGSNNPRRTEMSEHLQKQIDHLQIEFEKLTRIKQGPRGAEGRVGPPCICNAKPGRDGRDGKDGSIREAAAAATAAAHEVVTDRLHNVTKALEHESLYFMERVLIAHGLIESEDAQYEKCDGVGCDFCSAEEIPAS
jgi:hypothetical protein